MSSREELTSTAARVLLELANASEVQWDQAYYRFHWHSTGHRTQQLMCRLGRDLQPMAGIDSYLAMLDKLMTGLFELLARENSERPLVAALAVDAGRHFSLRLDYKNPLGCDIGYMALGTPNSYFTQDEVDIPSYVQAFRAGQSREDE